MESLSSQASESADPEPEIDIVIPAYNEHENIVSVMEALARHVRTSFRVLVCCDTADDTTLVRLADRACGDTRIVFVVSGEHGPHAAVRAGFSSSRAPAVLVYMADDDYNAKIIDVMVDRFRQGCDVVAASRFVPGGAMIGCHSRVKEIITRVGSFVLRYIAGIPVHDGTNAFRLFSRRLLNTIEIESRVGFTFSIELLAKAVRLRWRVAEVPAQWIERADRKSRFRMARWLPAYARWLCYALATQWLGRGPGHVRRRI
jgi:glycosyltransferase involved in cell wall biosynthesis